MGPDSFGHLQTKQSGSVDHGSSHAICGLESLTRARMSTDAQYYCTRSAAVLAWRGKSRLEAGQYKSLVEDRQAIQAAPHAHMLWMLVM